jgi:hypothetical protein
MPKKETISLMRSQAHTVILESTLQITQNMELLWQITRRMDIKPFFFLIICQKLNQYNVRDI